jgi:hypothetical protein
MISKKQCWTILHRLGEDLKEITLIVAVYQYTQFFKGIEVFIDMAHTVRQLIIVRSGHFEEFYPAVLEIGYGFNNIVGGERNVLASFAIVIIEVFFYLRFLFAFGRFIDGEFYKTVPIAHHLAHESGIFGGDIIVIERQDIPEPHYVLVKRNPWIHLVPSHITHAMVNILQTGVGGIVHRFPFTEAGHEYAIVIFSSIKRCTVSP